MEISIWARIALYLAVFFMVWGIADFVATQRKLFFLLWERRKLRKQYKELKNHPYIQAIRGELMDEEAHGLLCDEGKEVLKRNANH